MAELTKEQLDDFKEAFALFDKDGDGQITVTEFFKIMRSMGLNPTEAEVYDIIDEIDRDRSGFVDFKEFLVCMAKKTRTANDEKEIYEAFRVFDRDEDGRITVDDLRAVMVNLGEEFDEKDIHEMMAEVDLNGDGVIDFHDFLHLMHNK